MEKIDIMSLTLPELEEKIVNLGMEKYRGKQIFTWIHDRNMFDFGKMTDINKNYRALLAENFQIKCLDVAQKFTSSIDGTRKYLYKLPDGECIETVLMRYDHGFSVCLSTQVGCKMGCSFCASTKAGFVRNLTVSEMLMQLKQTEIDNEHRISNIVLMGIGEPLDNYDNVVKFLKLCGVSMRNVSLSTCGIIPQIYKLADEKLPLTLSISLHAPTQQKRLEIMPIAAAYPLPELVKACREYMLKTHRRITFEYTVIDNFNCSAEDAKNLAELLRGLNSHINLIPVNNIQETDYKITEKNIENFKKLLTKLGFNVTIRRKLGADINAACGELRIKGKEKEQ